ncbi:MAG: hypothetical protein WBG86_22230 [Polyangiales bacterium]
MSSFDVWVMGFETGEVPPAVRLARAFGLDETSARSLIQNLPRVVRHGLAPRQAGEMRKVLEAIGAEVECRPARRSKPVTQGRAAVFEKPEEDLLPGRVSAIDPFSPTTQPGVPSLSVDDQPAVKLKSDISGVVRPPSAVPPRNAEDAIRARAIAHQRKTYIKRAVTTMVAGVAVAVIGLLTGNSVFMGTANWFGVSVDGIAIFLFGGGAAELLMTLKERDR